MIDRRYKSLFDPHIGTLQLILSRAVAMNSVLLALGLLAHYCYGAGINVYPKVKSLPPTGGDVGNRLFLTPYVKNGDFIGARAASAVPPQLYGVESYSGFLTLDEERNANTFFWFFPSESNRHRAPLLLWLQGGPGAASIWAIFSENGPYIINEDLTLSKREYYWSQEFNVLYIDNPVGTGFSFTNVYVTNETEVGRDLHLALVQFFQLFPEYRDNDFYITGESYAGKYIPAAAYTIHQKNPSSFNQINLKGVAIGNGLVDPENMMKYGDYLFQHGLIDIPALTKFHEMEKGIVENIQNKSFIEAFNLFDELLNGDIWKYQTEFKNATGLSSYFNYVTSDLRGDSEGTLEDWLAVSENRKAIHVGHQIYDEGSRVEENLMEDVMQSAKEMLQVVMDNYRVLIYNGQLDIICAYPLTMNYLNKLEWEGKEDYLKAERTKWYVDGELAGLVKSSGNFTEILVRDAGHMVPADQPLWALDMITRFTTGANF